MKIPNKSKKAILDTSTNMYETNFFTIEFCKRNIAVLQNEEHNLLVSARIVSIRRHGKLTFLDVTDGTNKIQVMLSTLITKTYVELAKIISHGDYITFKGFIGLSKSGEQTIFCKEVLHTTKCHLSFPDKIAGVKVENVGYAHREWQFILDETYLKQLYNRDYVIRKVREILFELEYHEVETPILNIAYGGAEATPFITKSKYAKTERMFLRISPELHLKRLIVCGFTKIFEIGKCFRNEGLSNWHNPEFTMLEAYTVGTSLLNIKKLIEQIIQKCCLLASTKVITFNNKHIDISKPFLELNIFDFLFDKIGIDFRKIDFSDQMLKDLISRFPKLTEVNNKNWKMIELGYFIFDEYYSKHLDGAVFVYGIPSSLSCLAEIDPQDSRLALRYELIINGIEIANLYNELSDPNIQSKNFSNKKRRFGYDSEFVESLKIGLPPTVGFGIGLDRLVMLVNNTNSIKDVITFPQY